MLPRQPPISPARLRWASPSLALWGLALLSLLALWPSTVGAATEAPGIRQVRFEGAPEASRARLQSAVKTLLEGAASKDRLVEALEAVASVPGVGGVDIRLEALKGGAVDVVFGLSTHRRVVERLDLTTGSGPPAIRESARLYRQVQASRHPLLSQEGRPFQPWYLQQDVEAVRLHFVNRGHLDARVVPEVAEMDKERGLTQVILRVLPGPRVQLGGVAVVGMPRAVPADLPGGLKGHSVLPTPRRLSKAARALTRRACRAGYPEATVEIVKDRLSADQLAVAFRVKAGLPHIIQSVTLPRQSVPMHLLTENGLKAGAPWCPGAAQAGQKAVVAWLKERGFPNPDVQVVPVTSSPDADHAEVPVEVQVIIDPHVRTRIDRIWFEGNLVTRRDVLSSLVTVEEGQLFRQSDVDQSVQKLLRSGLFRRVSARVIQGDAQRCFVYFTVQEREILSVNFAQREVTFYNMDVTFWPSTLEEATDGVTLRGGGQQLTLLGQPDHQRIALDDPFALKYLVVVGALGRQKFTWSSHEETVWTGEVGVGFRGFENRVSLVPLVGFEVTNHEAPARYSALPVEDDDQIRLPLKLRSRLDLRLLDGERIAWLGALFDAEASTTALPGRSTSRDLRRYRADLSLFAPLGRNRTDQHYALRLDVGGRWVVPERIDRLAAHDRVTPVIRGYTSSTLRIDYPIPDDDGAGFDTVALGGLKAYTGSLSMRVPLFNKRRTALVPFVDFATVADDTVDLFEQRYFSAGLELAFSFFNERLEGFVSFAWPFDDTRASSYLNAGAGGSF